MIDSHTGILSAEQIIGISGLNGMDFRIARYTVTEGRSP